MEIILSLEAAAPPQLQTDGHNVVVTRPTKSRAWKPILIVVERTVFACLAVAVSIFIPEFSSMMAFLGSFSAFVLCVIGPVAAKMALTKKYEVHDVALLIIAVVSAIWGTVAAFAA